ncbi:C-type lectin domain family 2 member L-like [Mercenaria mercenaria]|uniref:C-type lectin domain family 2 member L-like n=1 Tax=Mercenaria mercenaria TaxID=6596 RepID=UPI00234F7EEB|nr:C-type lectin domain family 2 member L-like [Mercenaria mercenaria]
MYFVRSMFKIISLYMLAIFAEFSKESSVLYVRNTQYDGYMCEHGDVAASFGNTKNKRMCLSACAAYRCARVFYYPESELCLGCFSLLIRDSLLVSEGSVHYEAKCPSTYGQFNTSCYTYTDTQMTWDAAKNYCEKLNGYLATIESSDENSYVANWLNDNGVASTDLKVWIGVTDSQTEDAWQPDKITGVANEDCVAIEI